MTIRNIKIIIGVAAVCLMVLGVAGLVASVRTSQLKVDITDSKQETADSRAETAILRDSLKVVADANAILAVTNSLLDSTIAADSADWRKGREALVASADTARELAGSIATRVRAALDSTTAVRFDSMRAAERESFNNISEALDSTVTQLAETTKALSGAEAFIAGINSELALAYMEIGSLERTVGTQQETIDLQQALIRRYENSSWSTKIVNALPEIGTGIGVTLLVGAYVVTR